MPRYHFSPLSLLLWIILIWWGLPAHAATYTVTNLDDSGPGSLRQAVLDSNTTGASDVIEFQPGLTGTITVTSEIPVTGRMTINGPGTDVLAVSGGNATRIFNVSSFGATLHGLTIKGGSSNESGGGIYNTGFLTVSHSVLAGHLASANGGGIYNTGFLTLSNSNLIESSGSSGGGIYNDGGSVTLSDSTLSDNTAMPNDGGGIFSRGGGGSVTVNNSILSSNGARNGGGIYSVAPSVIVEDSTLSGNRATGSGAGIYQGNSSGLTAVRNSTLVDNRALASGGGIDLRSGSGSVRDSTLSGNSAGTDGGGIYYHGSSGTSLTAHNSTLSGNSAGTRGGGIYYPGLSSGGASMTVRNSTLSGNTAGTSGGGVYRHYNSDTADLGNSIIAGNSAPTGREIHAGLQNVLSSHNLYGVTGDPGVAGGFTPAATDQILAGLLAAALGPLGEHGGPTPTHALVAGSPAIDAGANDLIPEGLTTDQRGAGFPRIVGGTVDIGAVEFAGGGGLPTHTALASAGAGGAIAPASRTVAQGAATTFTITAEAGYHAEVSGCGGTLVGTLYTTAPLTADCVVLAVFHPDTTAYLIVAGAGANGAIAPAAQTVAPGATATFTVTPDPGYTAAVAGCGGTLAGATYTTGPIAAACSVVATFTPTPTATAPILTTPSLPDALVGVPTAAILTALGGQYPHTYAAVGLPPGLTLSIDGVLSGIPSTGGAFAPTVTVTDAGGRTGTRTYPLTVQADLTLLTRDLPDALVDVPYQQTLAALGGRPPYVFTAAGLPPGLSLAPDGSLGGIPREPGAAAVELTVTDAAQRQATRILPLVARAATFTEPNPERPAETISGAAATCPTADITTRTLRLGDPGAPAAGPDGVDLPYGLLEITVTGCQPGQTVLALTTVYPAPLPPGTQYWKWGPTPDDPTPHWYVLPGALVHGNAVTLLILDGQLGDADLTVDGRIRDPGGPGIPRLAIAGAPPPVGPLGRPYRADFQARCDAGACPAESAYHWSLTAGRLPPGLTLDGAAATATLHGTPTQAGDYPFTLQVLDRAAGHALTQQPYRIAITASDAATTLITHYYVAILEREPEADGLAFWQDQIVELQAQGKDAKPVFRDMANFFFNSPEYLGRHTSDLQFTTHLYRTFFQREPEGEGLAFWLAQLAAGQPRPEVMAFFLHSPEFLTFMQNLGF